MAVSASTRGAITKMMRFLFFIPYSWSYVFSVHLVTAFHERFSPVEFLIVTRDKPLLSVAEHQGVRIIGVSQVLQIIGSA